LVFRFAFHGCNLEALPRPLLVLGVAALETVPLDLTPLFRESDELRRQSLPVREDRRQMAREVTHIARENHLALGIQYVCGLHLPGGGIAMFRRALMLFMRTWRGSGVVISADRSPPTRVSVASGALILYRVYDEIGLVGLDHRGVRPGHCFYMSESSPLLSESARMNSAPYGRPLLHYAIYTGGRCIDIISTEEPRFVILREFASGRYASERPERTSGS
jgi:hypothetical protein